MRTVAFLLLATPWVWADGAVELTLRNPTNAPRAEIVTLRLYELDLGLPPAGGLQVLDGSGGPLPSQIDDLDLSGGLSPEDELAFLVAVGPHETVTVTVRAGDARMSRARWVAAGGLTIAAGGYRATIAEDGGRLLDLSVGAEAGPLVASLSQTLRGAGPEPGVVFSQQGLAAEIVHCVGPLREAVLARYDLDGGPPPDPHATDPGAKPRPGTRGEVLYAFYHDTLSVTHRVIAGDGACPVETCEVEALLAAPGSRSGVLSHWITAAGEGVLPGVADPQSPLPPVMPDLGQEPFVDLVGPTAGLALVHEVATTGAVELRDCRLEAPPRDLLSYTRFVDSAESTLWLVPHLARDDISPLLYRLSRPIVVDNPKAMALAELTEARGILSDLAAQLAEARRGESFVTPAEVQLRASEHLLAMAEVCARNHREVQASRLALEVAERASGARSFLADSQERRLRRPELGRDGEVLTGVLFTGRGRDFPAGFRRSLERLSHYGIGCIHDTDTLSWATCEPRPGTFDFRRPDGLMDMLQELGLRYLPCVDPWLSPPPWLDPAEAPAAAQRYLEQVLLRYRSHEAPLAWIVRNEPVAWGPEPEAPGLYGFRDWLARRYPTVDALNLAWGREHSEFSEVQMPAAAAAPRIVPDRPLSAPGPAPGPAVAARDLALYGVEAMVANCEALAKLARRLDPGRPAAVKSLDALCGLDPATVGDPWLFERVQDPVHCNSFDCGHRPGAAAETEGDRRLAWAFSTALQRSAVGGRPLWCAEWSPLECGAQTPPATRADVRLMTWTAVAEGLRGVFAHGHSGGNGVVGSFDDSPLPVLEEFGVLSAEFAALGPLLNESQPASPRIAVYWPRDSIFYGRAGGERHGSTRALRSLWQMLSVDAHYPLAFVSDREIAAGGLTAHDALILTGSPFLDAGIARHMADFTVAGGLLVVLGPCGVFDGLAALCDPAPVEALREVMGARITAVQSGQIAVGSQVITGEVPVACYAPVARYLTAAGQLAASGELAAYWRNVGRGHVLACGAELGVETDTPAAAGRRWLVEQLEGYGISAPVEQVVEGSEVQEVYARLFSLRERHHLLVANLSGEAGWCRLRVNASIEVSDEPVDLLTGTRVYPAPGHSVDIYLGSDDVRWVCL